MAILIGNHGFEGPFSSTGNLRVQSGVYAILGRSGVQDRWCVVDIGESGSVRDRVSNHDRWDSWKRQGHGMLAVAAHYCDERTRMAVEQQLRALFNPPCGNR